MLLFIGFNRIWHFTYVRLDAMLCGIFRLTQLPVASTFWRYVEQFRDKPGQLIAKDLMSICENGFGKVLWLSLF